MLKKWQQRFFAAAATLGFTTQLKAGSLSKDEQKLIFAEYEKTHNISFADDKKLNEDVEVEETLLSAEEMADIATLLGKEVTEIPTGKKAVIESLVVKSKEDKEVIKKLSSEPEEEKPIKVKMEANATRVMPMVLGHTPHSATHLFGIEDPMYLRSQWWNQITATRTEMGSKLKQPEKDSFMTAFTGFAEKLGERAIELKESNQISLLDYKQMMAGEGHIDYSNLQETVAGLGGEYVVRRTDLILAYLRSLPSVGNIFPVVSNIQNKELAPTATFGELSQGYREGRIFKGGVEFGAEVYQVIDVMFKYQFADLIALEKKYIGYLNRESSDVIKWSFIEWIMVYFGKQLINEQNRRRVIGVTVPQQEVVANPAMLAADGALRAIERVEEELKILPFEDLALYTDATMLDYVTNFWNKIVQILDTTEGYKIYGNIKHRPWYAALYAEKYTNATGVIVSGQQLPDLHPDNIIWVPNMPNNNYKMWITMEKNVENEEDKPFEMLAFYYFADFEAINVRSRWKEGSGVLQPGVKFDTLADLTASGRKMQWLFTNYPASALTIAATMSFAANNLFTVSGTVASVTTVNNASIETVYKLVAGADFATTKLVKAGAFSTITADFQPAAAGDYIKVYAELYDVNVTIEGKVKKVTKPTGKFLELERKVTV